MSKIAEKIADKEKHTPAHAPGFMDRLGVIFSELGIKPREYVSVIADSTGLSKSGARLVVEADRPPKQIDSFSKFVNYLSHSLKEKRVVVGEEQLANYLLTGEQNPFENPDKDTFSLTEFLEQDPILTSQIILKVEEVAKVNDIDTNEDISKDAIRLIYYRIAAHCFKNNIQSDFNEAEKQILSLLILAKDNLL